MIRIIIGIILAVSAFGCLQAATIKSKRNGEDSLELVHVIFRHGDRTPDRHVIYPNDPHINVSYSPVGFGQLTNAGKRKEYLLGKALRKRYGKFLGNYNIENVDARCTDYNRTKMSLQLVLASLFPPEDELVWEKRLKWQPVPFNYWEINADHILGEAYKNCKRYRHLYGEFLKSSAGINMYQNYTNIIDYIANHTGTDTDRKKLAELYFTLVTEHENGLKLPDWTETVFPKTVRELAILEYIVATATPEMRKMGSGFLVKKIIDDTNSKMKGTLPPHMKMFLYSAHEYNLAYLLRYLGVYYPHVPPYGSYILIEIHNFQGIRGIKVFYQDYSSDKPKKMNIPLCDNFCRLSKFVSIFKDLLPKGDEECHLI